MVRAYLNQRQIHTSCMYMYRHWDETLAQVSRPEHIFIKGQYAYPAEQRTLELSSMQAPRRKPRGRAVNMTEHALFGQLQAFCDVLHSKRSSFRDLKSQEGLCERQFLWCKKWRRCSREFQGGSPSLLLRAHPKMRVFLSLNKDCRKLSVLRTSVQFRARTVHF